MHLEGETERGAVEHCVSELLILKIWIRVSHLRHKVFVPKAM